MTGPRLVAGVAAIASCLLTACGDRPETKPEPALVRTAVAEQATLTRWLSLNGRVAPMPDRDASLAPLVAGRLLSVRVREGDLVRAGQVLASVDPGPLDDAASAAGSALERTAADARFRRSVAVRSAGLLAKGVVSQEEADSDEAAAVAAESTRNEASAALATARRQRARASLTAPFEGAVIKILRRAGEEVDGTPATPVVEIAAPDPWEAEAAATANDLDLVRPGQAAEILAGGPSSAGRAAHVVSVSRAVDAATGAGSIRLRPDRGGERITLGTSVQVRVALATKESAVVVPSGALRVTPDGGTEVVVVEDGVAHVRKVETGLTEAGRVEVTAGLDPGARVVVEDPMGLAEGTAVRERT